MELPRDLEAALKKVSKRAVVLMEQTLTTAQNQIVDCHQKRHLGLLSFHRMAGTMGSNPDLCHSSLN